MALLDGGLLLLAAVAAGALNAIVGGGTLITFPTLLALGYPPVVANVSSTVGLVPGAATAAYGFRHTLVGRELLLSRLVAAATVGGGIGGLLLLALPSTTFEHLVPVLLVVAAGLAALQPSVAAAVARRRAAGPGEPGDRTRSHRQGQTLLVVGVFLVGIYAGYFGGAQGVLLLALLGISLGGPMTELNGVKNVLAGVGKLGSALLFVVAGDVEWAAAALVAAGATVGGGLGGRYGRRLPSPVLRAVVVTVAVVAAVWQLASG